MNKKKLIPKCQNAWTPIYRTDTKKSDTNQKTLQALAKVTEGYRNGSEPESDLDSSERLRYQTRINKRRRQALAMMRAMQAGFSYGSPFSDYGDDISADALMSGVDSDFVYDNNDYLNIYTYLYNKDDQANAFEANGYILGRPGDYGLVQRAVGNRNLPVYQMYEDEVVRDSLNPIGNFTFEDRHAEYIPGLDKESRGNRNVDLQGHPVAVYKHKRTGDVYAKAWDLTDFGESSAGKGERSGWKYSGIYQKAANFLDLIGNPSVITTGFVKVDNPEKVMSYINTEK